MKRRGTLPIAIGSAVSLIAAGCGIPNTAVVDAGPPAVSLASPHTVYYVDGSDALVPVVLPPSATDPDRSAVDILFGPIPGVAVERGLSSQIPSTTRNPTVYVDDVDSEVVVTLPEGEPMLTGLGLRQLACTATALSELESHGEAIAVAVRDNFGSVETTRC